jgi:DNA-binding MarR family transcriptional regulator
VTVREDIIIHLSRHTFDEDEPVAPKACTSRGIASAIDTNVTYLSVQLTRLEAEGMIRHQRKQINERERTWKVQVYYLTPKGRRFVEFL